MANFEIGSIDEILNLQPMETVDFDENQDKEWDLLSKILNDDMEVTDVSCSTVNDEALREMDRAFEAANPVTSPVPYHDDKQKRFKSISEEELNVLQDKKQSKSTKKNTKWSISVFQGTNKPLYAYNNKKNGYKVVYMYSVSYIKSSQELNLNLSNKEYLSALP